jgi:hypothetical protein
MGLGQRVGEGIRGVCDANRPASAGDCGHVKQSHQEARSTEMTERACTERRELAHRSFDGIEVALFWSKPSNRATIAVLDSVCDQTLEFEVDGGAALDAFNHPYAHAAARRARDLAAPPVSAAAPTVGTDR